MQEIRENEVSTELTNTKFEEMEKVEEFGPAQDYITGISVGIGIVAADVAQT